jgi:hypothetical protein
LIIVLSLFGCVTTAEVERIVEDSNKTVIQNINRVETSTKVMGDIAVASLAPDGSLPTDSENLAVQWQGQVERIERFIAEHPEMTRTNNALRMREAIVLLSAKKIALARVVFAEVDPTQLSNKRDRAIYEAREHLLWWYGLGNTMSQSSTGCNLAIDRTGSNDCARALNTLDGLAAVVDDSNITLEKSAAVTRFLEQVRVRVAVRLANAMDSEDDILTLLSQALARYEDQFSSAERSAIHAWHLGHELSAEEKKNLLSSLRWYDYVPSAYKKADALIDEICSGDCPRLTPEWVKCIEEENC